MAHEHGGGVEEAKRYHLPSHPLTEPEKQQRTAPGPARNETERDKDANPGFRPANEVERQK